MLYMRTRVTFRIPGDLAHALRELPNQTKFVEDSLRDALGKSCPLCLGSGRVPLRPLEVTNLRLRGLRPLRREEAVQLRRLVRLGREVAATRLELARYGRRIEYTLSRERDELVRGTLGKEKESQ